MNRVIDSLEEWTELLQREYPSVRFDHAESHPPGINAVTAGLLVGRYHTGRTPPSASCMTNPAVAADVNEPA